MIHADGNVVFATDAEAAVLRSAGVLLREHYVRMSPEQRRKYPAVDGVLAALGLAAKPEAGSDGMADGLPTEPPASFRLSTKQVAVMANVAPRTVQYAAEADRLRAVKHRARWLVDEDDARRWAEEMRGKAG